MTRHTLNGRLLQYTIAPEFRGNWRMRKRLKPVFSSPAIIREPGYEAIPHAAEVVLDPRSVRCNLLATWLAIAVCLAR